MAYEKFWMLWVEGERGPNVKHHNLQAAKWEAEKLARQLKKRVYLLEAIESCAQEDIPQPPVKWEEMPLPPDIIGTREGETSGF